MYDVHITLKYIVYHKNVSIRNKTIEKSAFKNKGMILFLMRDFWDGLFYPEKG